MKKLILTIIIVFFTTSSFAGTWCYWDAALSKGASCQSDSKGFILIDNFPVKTQSIAHSQGWYELTINSPTVGVNQVTNAEVWILFNNQITKTWTVRNLTTTELDERTAQAMDENLYWLIKGLLLKGTFTLSEAQNFFPASVIAAYQARARLE